jgi:hypothetical protein
MIHQLKIESEYFRKIVEGVKTFEVRKNDRDFQKGDYLGLNEITLHPCNTEGERKETGNFVLVRVLDIFGDNRFIKDGHVIMSIRPCTIKEIDWDYAPWYTSGDVAVPILPKDND